jgi:hypothetical protein
MDWSTALRCGRSGAGDSGGQDFAHGYEFGLKFQSA